MKAKLINKLHDKTAIIGIVGLGYVGLPLAIRYAEVGYKVIGLDIDSSKAENIAQGKTYIEHIPNTAIQTATQNGFEATTDFTRAAEADALILCVPTPLDDHREPDLSFVIDTLESLRTFCNSSSIRRAAVRACAVSLFTAFMLIEPASRADIAQAATAMNAPATRTSMRVKPASLLFVRLSCFMHTLRAPDPMSRMLIEPARCRSLGELVFFCGHFMREEYATGVPVDRGGPLVEECTSVG